MAYPPNPTYWRGKAVSPHPLDKWGQWFLIDIAESAQPPSNLTDDDPVWSGDIEFTARDGWKVTFFYDVGELDYIDHFTTPEGEELPVFGQVVYDTDDDRAKLWPPVMAWRGVGRLDDWKERSSAA